MMRLRVVRQAAVGIALTLALASARASVGAAEPFEINVLVDMTGYGSFLGKAEQSTLGILETTVNNGGGLAGRPIKLVVQDDQSSPQTAVQLVSGLLAKGVPVIVGPSTVAECQAVAPLIREKAVMFCISAGFHSEAGSYAYFAGISTFDQLAVAVRYLRLRGLTKIAAITSVDANGQDADRGIAAALARPENKGVSLVAPEHFQLADLTVDAQMSRIRSSGAQALINYSTGTPFGTVLHGYADVGLDIPMVTNPAALNAQTVNQYASYLPKEFLVTALLADAPGIVTVGPVRTALNAYLDACKAAGIQPDHTTALAWDPLWIVIAAYKALGLQATGPQINAFIQNLHGWAGINGEYDFRTGQGGLGAQSQVIVRWNPQTRTWDAVSKPGGALLSGGSLAPHHVDEL